MFELTRTVRFCINLSQSRPPRAKRHNTFAAYPSMDGIGVFYEIDVCCRGNADPTTGYVMNISAIDEAVRQQAIPLIRQVVLEKPDREPSEVLAESLLAIQDSLAGSVSSIRWRLSPYYSLSMRADTMDRFQISQQFDFAAAHRLNSPSLDAEGNRKTFGKCNNPNGHGHNYRLQVDASTSLSDPEGGPKLDLASLERIVNEQVIRRFDHTHLNLDTPEFADLNPSVEHIAKVCHELLLQPIDEVGGRLELVTIWETDRTSCSYPAPPVTPPPRPLESV